MSSGRPLVVVGDALLDRDVTGRVERLCPDAPVPVLDETGRAARAGGAGLAASLAAADGREVTLVTALATDRAGAELRARLEAAGVEVVDLGLAGATPEKVRLRADGHSLLRLDRGGAAGAIGALTAAARAAIGWAGAVLVADYGRGVAAQPGVREALVARGEGVALVWDPHPRGSEPVAGAELATPNADEAARFAPGVEGGDAGAAAQRALALAGRWRAGAVCVTRGAGGAVLAGAGIEPLEVGAEPVGAGDPCGAGDRFAATVAGALADGAGADEAVKTAVDAATAFVAAGGAGALLHPSRARMPDARRGPAERGPGAGALGARVPAAGGTIVATGGCFDLLHAGHVRTLQAARALGDCLVVLLNSDESVRRLKGPDRPVVAQEDRAAVLQALGCVDAVLVFEEDTPAAALDRLRPDVWAKGGDYVGRELPEDTVLARWGGRSVVLPFLAGRSTTRLIEEALTRVG